MRACDTRTILILGVLLAGALPSPALQHSRTEIQIPMRDVHPVTLNQTVLAADLYLPNDGAGPWPVILIQTPYNKLSMYAQFLGRRADDPLFNSTNYTFVVMDWRGKGTSGSEDMAYAGSPSGGEDGYDAVEWLAVQPWCTGKVGTWGPSGLGNVQMRTAAEQPPHLECAVPIVYHYREWYDQNFPGGVYARNRNDVVYGLFGLDIFGSHPLYDLFWTLTEAASGDPSLIDVPMLHVSGWYDHEPLQTIREMTAIQTDGGPNAVGRQKLLIGPWSHSSVGDLVQNELEYPTAEYGDTLAALDFFDFYLRGISNDWESTAPIRYFQTNEDRWIDTTNWPPAYITQSDWFLHTNGVLSASASTEDGAYRHYISDPTNPVPAICGALLDEASEWVQGPGDLGVIESRQDVLAFTTPSLAQPLVVAGNPSVRLWMQCDTVDTDLAVRLTQVYPDGRSMWLTDGIRRASLRNGFAAKELLNSNQVYEVTVELPPVAVTIPVGHSLRLLVMPSNDDRFDVNYQDGSDLSDDTHAVPTVATVRIFADTNCPSRLELPIVWASQVDSDGDGMPDVFEETYFGGYTSGVSTAHSDTDPHDNLAEYVAGTNPTNSDSVFQVFATAVHGEPVISFETIQATGHGYEGLDRVYTLFACSNLLDGTWSPLSGYSNILGVGQSVFFSNDTHSVVRFFRGKATLIRK